MKTIEVYCKTCNKFMFAIEVPKRSTKLFIEPCLHQQNTKQASARDREKALKKKTAAYLSRVFSGEGLKKGQS